MNDEKLSGGLNESICKLIDVISKLPNGSLLKFHSKAFRRLKVCNNESRIFFPSSAYKKAEEVLRSLIETYDGNSRSWKSAFIFPLGTRVYAGDKQNLVPAAFALTKGSAGIEDRVLIV